MPSRALMVALAFVPLAAALWDCKPLTEVAADPDYPELYSCYDDDTEYTRNGTCCAKQCPTDMICITSTDTDPCPARRPTPGSACTHPSTKYCYYALSNQNQLGEQLTVPMFTEFAQCESNQWLVAAYSTSSNTCDGVEDAYKVECCGADRAMATTGPQGATTCGALQIEFKAGGCCANR